MDISNGVNVTYDHARLPNGSLTVGTVATYGCMDGFALLNGDTSRTCTGNGTTVNGEFDGQEPSCEGENCES